MCIKCLKRTSTFANCCCKILCFNHKLLLPLPTMNFHEFPIINACEKSINIIEYHRLPGLVNRFPAVGQKARVSKNCKAVNNLNMAATQQRTKAPGIRIAQAFRHNRFNKFKLADRWPAHEYGVVYWIGWDGVGWGGMGWDGVGWDGVGWGGVGGY